MSRPIHFTFFLTVFLLLLPAGFAAEDFVAGMSSSALSFCTLSTVEDVLTVSNTGNLYSEYKVSAHGRGSEYITILPSTFSLMPGESAELVFYYHFPAGSQDTYDVEVLIETGFGLQKKLTKTLQAHLCNNNVLLAHNFNQSACPCLPMNYDFTIKNTGTVPETYVFSLDEFSSYANVSANPLVLSPGEESQVQLQMNLDCSIYGTHIVYFSSHAQSSGISSSVPLLLDIDKCYDYALSTGKLLENTDERYDEAYSFESSSYSVCAGDHKSLQIELDNYGYVGNNFRYTLEGPQWASLYGDTLQLDGYEKGYSFIDLNPPQGTEGEHTLVLTAQSQRGKQGEQQAITVKVNDCYGLAMEPLIREPVCLNTEQEVAAQLSNIGLFEEEITLEIFQPKNILALRTPTLTLDAGESAEFFIDVPPSYNFSEQYWFQLRASVANNRTEALSSVGFDPISLDECYQVFIEAQDISVLVNESWDIPFTIIHEGSKPTTYRIDAEADAGVHFDTINITLLPGERSSQLLSLSTHNLTSGNYPVRIRAAADSIAYQHTITLSIRDSPHFLQVFAQGLNYYRYWVYGGIVLAILVVLFAFIIRERVRSWKIKRLIMKTLKEEKKKKASKAAKKVKGQKPAISLLPIAIAALLIIVVVLLSLFSMRLWEVVLFVLSFILEYIWYIIVGFILLWVIISVLNRMEKK